MRKLKMKRPASGSIGYCLLFGMAIILVIVTMYLMQASKLMTHQHDIDDALADSVLGALVADDIYYFETYESTGTPVVRFRNRDEAHNNFVSCMNAAVSNTQGFYYNFAYVSFIEYEVEGNQVKITTYSGNGGVKSSSTGLLGNVKTPGGATVVETSAYAKVKFDIKSILDGSYITKYRDLYCTLEVN